VKLRLGVIGLSEGNGHPYSWSAIFNGYDRVQMAECPFPVIGEYLGKQNYPADFLSDLGQVTHIWTQEDDVSTSVALAAKIPHIVKRLEDLVEHVDAILLARDDAENHVAMSLPFLRAGLPIFIDKPFALSLEDASTMLDAQLYKGQIFTCSALRFARELKLTGNDMDACGDILYAEGIVMKNWETYGIHILEPLITQLPFRGRLLSVNPTKIDGIQVVVVRWEKCMVTLRITGKVPSPIALSFYGKQGVVTKTFGDSFSCFKASLKAFVEGIQSRTQSISRSETIELVEIIERGRC
jgi:hypothetical protein